MAWLVDDLTGAMFGPWGLAAAVGAGVAFAAGKRLAPTVAGATSGAVAGVSAGAASARDRVRGGVAGGLTDVRDWWSDLYAEAHAEWEQGRATPMATARAAGAVAAKPARTRRAPVRSRADVAAKPARGPKVRGSNGRYIKMHAE
jgi:hypothetical protein